MVKKVKLKLLEDILKGDGDFVDWIEEKGVFYDNNGEYMKIVRRKLKPLEFVINTNGWKKDGDKGYFHKDKGYYINNTMAEKFGNNKEYNFRVNTSYKMLYEYNCVEDGYGYIKSWFMSKTVISDFISDDLFLI